MKINFDQNILDLDGEPMKAQKKINGEVKEIDWTIKDAVVQALTTLQAPVGAEENFSRYMIARNIKEGKDVSLDDAKIIKDACTNLYGPVPFGRISEALEGAGAK